MNVELQGKNIGKFSADIGYGMNDHKNADFTNVEQFACVQICFNSGMDESLIFLVVELLISSMNL